jgi:type IV pilus assembly protein PilB
MQTLFMVSGHESTLTDPTAIWQHLLARACHYRASDIHIEPIETGVRCRFRIDGVLVAHTALPNYRKLDVAREALCAHIKVQAGMDIAQQRMPQDGHLTYDADGAHTWDCRVSSLPTVEGEKLVIRLLGQTTSDHDLGDLGYTPSQLRDLESALDAPNGLILMTGPTGCGKTISLYSCLARLNQTSVNICTVEDPVEMPITGVQHLQINEKAGLTFPVALRAFLRQDPDVIMVGEIRDDLTAHISIQAAQTGHLVLSTLHTKDAPAALIRLIHMGVPAIQVVSAVRLVTAQRLLRKLCPHCKKPKPNQDPQTALWFIPVGCPRCVNGYQGRIGIFQILPMSEQLGASLLSHASVTELAQQAAERGIQTLQQSGQRLVDAGITSVEELRRNVDL